MIYNVNKLSALCSSMISGLSIECDKMYLFSDIYQPILSWLLSSGVILNREMNSIIMQVNDVERYIADVAYDCLAPKLRDAVK